MKRLSNDHETQSVIKKMLCTTCGGVVICSYTRVLAAGAYGKWCKCKDCQCAQCRRKRKSDALRLKEMKNHPEW